MGTVRALVGMDYHLNSNRMTVGKRLMRDTTELAKESNCKQVIIVGDLLDERTGVKVELLNMLYNEFDVARSKGIQWIWLRGNHELAVKSRPDVSVMPLFAGVATIVSSPVIWELPDATILCLLPWYLPGVFIKEATDMAARARQYPHHFRVLFSHIGLKEGHPSSSNVYVDQGVSLQHLHETAYSRVILGDYHHRQYLSDTTMYGGCPISHSHGDESNNGVWLLDTNTRSLEPISFPYVFPAHRTWRVDNPEAAYLPGYHADDHNRIFVAREWVSTYQANYPDATVIATQVERDTSARRLKLEVSNTQGSLTPQAIWAAYARLNALDIPKVTLGEQILQQSLLRKQATAKG